MMQAAEVQKAKQELARKSRAFQTKYTRVANPRSFWPALFPAM
jgi:hypothetical protein